jgi:hypothetical protein
MLKTKTISSASGFLLFVTALAGCASSDGRKEMQKLAMDRVGEIAGWKPVAPPKFRELTADFDTYVDYVPSGGFAKSKRQLCNSLAKGNLGGMLVDAVRCFGRDEFRTKGVVNGTTCFFRGSVVFVTVAGAAPNEVNALEIAARCYGSN